MFITDIKTEYLNFLNRQTNIVQVDDHVSRITAPFLDAQNDFIEIYIVQQGENSFLLTDDGITLDDLEMQGVHFEKASKRYEILQHILYGLSIDIQENTLCTKADEKNLAQKLYLLTQAIQKVSDLQVLSREKINRLFQEDVQRFFDQKNIRCIADPLFIGKTKLQTKYDFVIPKSQQAPERLIQTISSIDLNRIKQILFGWSDTKEVRDASSVLYVLYDDRIKKISDEHRNALQAYHVDSIPWTEINQNIQKLSA